MMPDRSPVRIPAYLRGDADQDTLADLVEGGRRLGLFWPLQPAAKEPVTKESVASVRHPGFKVSAREARRFGNLSPFGD
ncbi:hypothetical protein [Streptacidiphilus fuscans]|uniref:Uncharacterized protein n=1 Tax=Streptacidiphilus fuscans TaxID=2789292 RepID=A0A931FHV0_9ACTN|nr:hypothetical protein [Streptacidiphilus fuscans]MBF9071074.1 hypothetical protein [Streptacidiphilus fuscans]